MAQRLFQHEVLRLALAMAAGLALGRIELLVCGSAHGRVVRGPGAFRAWLAPRAPPHLAPTVKEWGS